MTTSMWLAVLLGLVVAVPSPGRQVDGGLSLEQQGHGYWCTYGVGDGLGTLDVHAVFRDRDGTMWFVSVGGDRVWRHDGRRFRAYDVADGLPHDLVRDVLEDRDGNIWPGTLGGVIRYDGTSRRHFSAADGLPEGQGWNLVQVQDGRVWVVLRPWQRRDAADRLASFDGVT